MLDFEVMLLVTLGFLALQLLIRQGNPIRKRLDSEVMLLVIFRTSSVVVVETSREPYTKNVGFRSHVACIF